VVRFYEGGGETAGCNVESGAKGVNYEDCEMLVTWGDNMDLGRRRKALAYRVP
jgi:hypothetical protein